MFQEKYETRGGDWEFSYREELPSDVDLTNDFVEVRVTRPEMYPAGSSPEGMQGHYFTGVNFAAAMRKAQAKFPGERLSGVLWKVKVVNDQTGANGRWETV